MHDPNADDAATWVTLREASEAAGVSVSWLRKQYRRNALATRDEPGPRGPQKVVPLEDVLALSAPFATPDDGIPAPATNRERTVPRAAAGPEPAFVDRLVESENRATRAETDAAHLQARLEAALVEIRRLRRLLAEAYDPPTS